MKHRLSWGVFVLAGLGAIVFITRTSTALPMIVAAHFDAAGNPTAFMLRPRYEHSMLLLGIGGPAILVALLTWVYSRATDMKLPNRDYWLAPERIGRTRDLLVAHCIWFGTLLISMVCYVHWLLLGAHRRPGLHLANDGVYAGLLVFLLITTAWILAMLRSFRRPPGQG